MRSRNIFTLFIVIFFLAALACNNDEDSNNNENPDSNNIGQNANQNFENQQFNLPSELKYTRQGDGFIYDKIYPVGWSKDGKFAYIIEPADEGSGLYWFEIIILDIVNNKIAWSWKPGESEEGNLESTWKQNYDLFAEHLNEAEIVQIKSFELKPPKSSYKGNDYELVLESRSETDQFLGLDVVREIELSFVSPELGKKLFYNRKIEEVDYVVSAYVPGYLMSPYDDRIVVVLQQERMGYEGPPNVVYFELIGSDLTRGFKKESGS